MTIRPAAPQPIPLDALIARAHGGAVPRLPDRAGPPSPHTPPVRETLPQAVVLCVTVALCAKCNTVHRMPGKHVLVRYDAQGLSNTLHCTPIDLDKYTDLPRELKEFHIQVPACEGCFAPQGGNH